MKRIYTPLEAIAIEFDPYVRELDTVEYEDGKPSARSISRKRRGKSRQSECHAIKRQWDRKYDRAYEQARADGVSKATRDDVVQSRIGEDPTNSEVFNQQYWGQKRMGREWGWDFNTPKQQARAGACRRRHQQDWWNEVED